MTYARGAGTLEAKVTECLHTLAPKAVERATLAQEAQDVIDGAQAIRDAVEPPYADVASIGGAG